MATVHHFRKLGNKEEPVLALKNACILGNRGPYALLNSSQKEVLEAAHIFIVARYALTGSLQGEFIRSFIGNRKEETLQSCKQPPRQGPAGKLRDEHLVLSRPLHLLQNARVIADMMERVYGHDSIKTLVLEGEHSSITQNQLKMSIFFCPLEHLE
jgi:hypothetical protein